ncbi:MAG: O-antigen ligase family protein, partial [Patescibacteria group bacterium]
GIFSQVNAPWFQDSFLRNLTSQKGTFQTRLISWRGAAADFKNHPFLGTGYGNYADIFDRNFTSDFYNYATSDTYFDRAHNNIIDITSTTGIVGLITYLSIFFAVLYYLWQEFKLNGKRSGSDINGLNNIEIIVIISLITAYFIQNLAIFDSFSTFIGLMTILGFIYWLDLRRSSSREENSREPRFVIRKDGTELIALLGLLLITYLFTNQYNVKPWKMFVATIDGYSRIASGNLVSGVEYYKNNLVGNPMERDARVTLINLVISNPSLLSALKADQSQEILDYTIGLAKLNVSNNPGDSMMQMQLAQILEVASRFSYNNLEKFNFYSSQAMQAIDASIEASPGRATTYFIKAQMQLIRTENDAAIATMKEGIALNTNYFEGYCRLSQIYLIVNGVKSDPITTEALNSCFDKGGLDQISSTALLKSAINYYSDLKDYIHAAAISERLATISESDPTAWYNLAQLYLVIGNDVKAEESFQKAVLLDPTLSKGWQEFKKVVETGRKK